MNIEKLSFTEYTTRFIREVKEDTCCGVSYIVDGHDDADAILSSIELVGSSLTLVIMSYGHCPVCEEHYTFMTQCAVDGMRTDIVKPE